MLPERFAAWYDEFMTGSRNIDLILVILMILGLGFVMYIIGTILHVVIQQYPANLF
jgi:hypothetical protein